MQEPPPERSGFWPFVMPIAEHRLGWLAGVIDGEGSIVVYTSKSGRNSCTARYEVTVGNTDERLVRAVSVIFAEIGVAHTIKLQHRRHPHRPCWYVTCSGGKGVEKVLSAMRSYLISKQARADLVLGMIQHRRSGGKGNQHFANAVDGDAWFLGQMAQFKELNKRGVPA